jgi:hypothetical protein
MFPLVRARGFFFAPWISRSLVATRKGGDAQKTRLDDSTSSSLKSKQGLA